MPIDDGANEAIQESYREERLARGTRLRLKELAELAGVSKSKVREDLKRGEFAAVRVRCGIRWRAEVEPIEARRYLAQLFHAA